MLGPAFDIIQYDVIYINISIYIYYIYIYTYVYVYMAVSMLFCDRKKWKESFVESNPLLMYTNSLGGKGGDGLGVFSPTARKNKHTYIYTHIITDLNL